MKKTFKIAAFVAAAMMGFGFVSCANDDAEDLGTLLIVKDYQEKKEAEAAAAAAAAKAASSSSDGSGSSETAAAESYTLDISKVPETTGTTNKIDDTVTVISTVTNKSGKAQTIKYSNNSYVQMSGAGVSSGYGLQLTLTGAATIKVKATKKASGTATAVKLIDTDGTEKGKTSGIDENGATSLTEYSISVDAAGTYIIGADSNGCFLFSLVIEYK